MPFAFCNGFTCRCWTEFKNTPTIVSVRNSSRTGGIGRRKQKLREEFGTEMN
jgi:hypothetical protein